MNSEVNKDEVDPNMVARLRLCADLVGSGDELSRKTGIPRRSLENYLSGKTTPKLKPTVAIAKKAGVSLEWLITGEGEMRSGGIERLSSASSTAADLMPDLLENVVTGVEIFLSNHGFAMQPDRKARLVVTLYRIMARRRALKAGQPFEEEVAGHPIQIDGDPDLVDIARMAL